MPAFRPEVDRFWEKVDKHGPIVLSSRCWIWTGGTLASHKVKYGNFYLTGGRRRIMAHRYSYELHVGQIPEGLVIDHLCRQTLCVNPKHLEPVTQRVNILRGVGLAAGESRQTQCKRGHSLADAHILRTGSRDCRQCRIIRNSNRVR